MKNNDVNKNILKAISIGLSATLSLMPTVTAYADDGGEGNIGRSDPVEDTATVSAPESDTNDDVKEEVREAETVSETAQTAAETIAQTPAPTQDAPASGTTLDTEAAASIAGDMGQVVTVEGDMAAALAALDQANAKVLEENAYYQETAGVGAVAITQTNEKTAAASEAIKKADTDISEKSADAVTVRDDVEAATEKIYDNKKAAETAKSEATSQVEGAEQALEVAKGEAEAAQTKLNEAEKALEVANDKVGEAQKAKEAADAAEKEAQDKLDKILKDNGLETDEDGNVDTGALKGDLKKAVESAQAAVEKATAMAEKAGQDLTDAKGAADEAAGAVADAAKNRGEAAQTKHEAAVEHLASFDGEVLESLIEKIKEQQGVVKGTTAGLTDDLEANKNIYDAYEQENNKLAAMLAQYKMAQNPDVDPASVAIVYNDDGSVVRNSGGNFVTVSYKLKGSDETHYAYYGYKAYEGSGEESKKNEFRDPDHIVLFEKTAKDEAAASFAGKGDSVLTLSKSAGLAAPEDESLTDLVNTINDMKAKIKDKQWEDMRGLAAYLAEYYLATDKGLDPARMTIPLGLGNNKKLNGQADSNYILIDYTDADKKVHHYYFDYDSSDTYKDNFQLLEKKVTKWTPSGMETATDKAISESEFSSGRDGYQSAKTEVSDSEKEIAAAEAAKAAAEDLAKRYEDTELAKAARDGAQADYSAFMENYKESERMDQLIDLMKQQQEKVQQRLQVTEGDFYQNSGELARYMAEYYLLQQEDVVPGSISVGEWHRYGANQKNKDHYFAVTYQVKGSDEVKTLYFDYLPVYANGEVLSGSTTQGAGKTGSYGTAKDVDHIELVTKTPANEAATSFRNKGVVIFDERDFNAGQDDYQASKTEKARLEKAVEDAENVYATAEKIKQLRADEATANDLKQKVDSAKTAVDEATAALAKARKENALNNDLLQKLQQDLAEAKKAYNEAKDAKAEADKKLETMKATVKEARDLLDREFRYRTPAPSGDTDVTPDEDVTPDTDPGTTDPVPASVVPGGEIGDTTPDVTPAVPGGAPAAATGAAGGVADAGVLGEAGAPIEGEVLGQRQAPVADAEAYDMASELAKDAAAGMTEGGLEKLSWWWMLIVAIFGQAGYKLYEKSRRKKAAATAADEEKAD